MGIAKKPYKITLWGDDSIYVISDQSGRREVTDLNLANGNYTILNHNFREVPLVTIGSNTMDTPVRAFNPKLVSNLNGSHTLTFDVFYRYYDEGTDTYKLNPFISLLANERKVKLEYDGEIYDLVIKEVQENSYEYIFSYTCIDQYINELAKAGYEIEMDIELENNMGTVVELGDSILEGSDWRVNRDDCDLIKQKNVENLFAYTLRSSVRATVMDDYEFIDNMIDEHMTKGTVQTIPAGQTIWVCYSSIINEDPTIQFFWRNRTSTADDYVVDEDGVIMNSPNWQSARPTIDFNIEDMEASDVYFGNMLVSKQKTVYLQTIDRYCTVWKRGGQTYYCFQDTEYASVAEIQQMLTNGANFTSTMGWTGVGNTTVSLSQIVPDGVTIPTLRCAFKASSPEIRNTGFYDHRSLTKGFNPGEKYVFAVKTSPAGAINGARIVGAPMDAPYPTGETTFVTFSRMTANVPTSLVGYDVFLGTVTQALSYEQMLRYTLDFCAGASSGRTIELIDAKLFKYAIGKNGYIIVPDMETTMNSVVKVRYNFFTPAALNGVTNIDNLSMSEVCYEGDAALSSYTPDKDETFEKIRSITGSKSNRFNLIQELCETFECWAKFTIEHFSDGSPRFVYQVTNDPKPVPGKIYYSKVASVAGDYGNQYSNDYNFNERTYADGASFYGVNYERHILKWVSFKEFIGQDNWAGFKYGINLKGIQRKIDSNQLVSKMIVQPNANEYAENGSCTIQMATMNPTKETAMYNFNYFIQNGLLNRADLNRDLFGDSTGGMAYFSKLHAMNERLEPDIYELGQLGNVLVSLIARQQVYGALVEEAKNNYQEYITDIAKGLGISQSAAASVQRGSQYNDVINSWITKRNTAASIINQYTDVLTNTNALVSSYESEYNKLKDSLQVLAEQKEALNKMFYTKYSRFIQEGTWISEDYIDPDLYYMDAVEVLRTSAFPQVTYTIDVLELSEVEGFEPYTFHIGDKTYMEDTEFFGYNTNGSPYREEIVITQVLYHLDDPSQNTVTVANYKTQFEDLFQRIAAATTTLQYAEGVYNRAGSAVNGDGTLNSAYLKNSLEKNVGLIMGAPNGELTIDQDKGQIIASSGRGDLILNSLGILVGTGGSYQTAISAEGINANVITTGRLNTKEVFIYGDDQETFRWDTYGLSAYAFDMTSTGDVVNVNYNKFVRMDRFGLYGIVNKTNYKPASVDEVIKDAMFSLTWKGLTMNVPEQTADVININNKFRVDGKGNVVAASGSFSGHIEAESGTFRGTVYATDGEFTGTIHATAGEFTGALKAATIQGTLSVDATTGGELVGPAIYVPNKTFPKFKVDDQGNVTMSGNINMENGNITWGSSNSPVRALYARTYNYMPTMTYDNYPANSAYGWHKTLDSARDFYVSYSYDGGKTWTTTLKLQGEDGQDGQNGEDGQDANVTRGNIARALYEYSGDYYRDGIYSYYQYGRYYLAINASYILAGDIDADNIALTCGYGGFTKGYGSTGTRMTYGSMMYGSNGKDKTPYFIVTDAGCRMSAPNNIDFFITGGGVYSAEEPSITSDKRVKNSIEYDMKRYEKFFMLLKPTQYRLNRGMSGRFHTGFIAQDVEQAILESGLELKDFAGITITPVEEVNENDGIEDNYYKLRYGEFISLNTYMIQKLYKRIEELEKKLALLN